MLLSGDTPRGAVRFAEHLEGRRLFSGQLFPGESLAVGPYPDAVLTVDLNGDGRLDVATANNDGNGSVSVLLGNGDGTFAAANTISDDGGPTSITSGDFNNDGKVDLATANSFSNTVSVLLGNGDGTFAPASSVVVGVNNPLAITTGDFNNDGKIDLAAACDNNSTTANGSVAVLLGNGNGTFAAGVKLTVGAEPQSITTGDFNGDHKADLMTANYTISGTVSVLLGNGNGTFGAASGVTVGPYPRSVTTGDFNGDGKADLATASYNSNGTASVRLGSGDGTFAAANTLVVGPYARSIATGDFNGDGKTDLVIASAFDPGLVTTYYDKAVVLLGNGNGSFAAPNSFTVGQNPLSIATGDFNGDGKSDLAAARYNNISGNNAVTILLGNANSALIGLRSYKVGEYPYSIQTADLNGDGKTDLVIPNWGNDTLSVLVGNGNGTFATPNSITVAGLSKSVVISDFNGDGKTDVAVTGEIKDKPPEVLFFPGNGDGTFATPVRSTVVAVLDALTAGDFNGDGKVDLVAANAIDNNVAVLLGNGDGTFIPTGTFGVGKGPTSIATGDFNADGKIDLAVANESAVTASILLGIGNGTFAAATTVLTGAIPTSITTGDFNADGKIDLTVANGAGSVSVLLGNGNGTFATRKTIPIGSTATAVTTGDFNGDGKTDLAAPSGNDIVSVLAGNGDGTFASARLFAVDESPHGLAAADFNGDGKTDLAVTCLSSTDVYGSGPHDVSILLNQSLPPYVGVAGGVVTIFGTSSPITVGLANGLLSIDTPAGPVTLPAAGVTSLVLNGVNMTFATDLGPAGGNGTIGLAVRADATATFNASEHLAALTVNGTATLAAGGKVLRVSGLGIGSAGRLDLNDGNLVYDYTGATPQADAVRRLIAAGRANGAWTGFGLTSTAAKNRAGRNTTLGYLEATDYKSIYGGTAAFVGEPLDDTAVVVKYVLYGDSDLDGGVSMNDFNRLSATFGTVGQNWLGGDYDADNGVSIIDFNLLAMNFGKTLAGSADMPSAAASLAVPRVVAAARTATIGGVAFNDTNTNGKLDTGDTVAAGKTIWLDLDDDGKLDPNEPTAVTGKDGRYTFRNLAAGRYHVRRAPMPGYKESTPPLYVTLAAGQSIGNASIGGRK